MRKFEKIELSKFKEYMYSNTKLNDEQIENIYNNIKLPERQTKYSAGYDFFSPVSFTIMSGNSIYIPTGIKVCMPEDEYLSMHIRSSYGFKYNIRLKNSVGIVGSDYYNNNNNGGHIIIALINNGNDNLCVNKDDKIAQGIFCKYFITDDDDSSEERSGGIGSTGK